MNEIRAALAVGKEVIVHTDPITVPGWKGAGYIITDPQTGAGAWKIGGGANGAYLEAFGFFLGFVGLLGVLLGASAFFIIAIALISIATSLINFFMTANTCGDVRDDVNLSLNLGVATVGAIFGVFGKVGATIFATINSWIFSTAASTAIGNSCR